MAAELAASIVAAASTLHEQHTERKILRVIEGDSWAGRSPLTFGQDRQAAGLRESKDIPRELFLVWHEKESRPDSESWTWPVPRVHGPPPSGLFNIRSASDPPSRPLQEMRVPLAELLAETRWTIEREIKPAGDVSYLVLARQTQRPRPGPPAGGI